MKLRRIMIAAPKSGSGKTAVTCALLQILKEQGQSVASYKCGPDYIDPMFHKTVLQVPSKNLDTFFTDPKTTRQLFLAGRNSHDIAVLEGVMGLFDGLGGIREEGSSYQLAQVTKTPIILVIDGKGMGRSLAALIRGFLDYDRDHLIKGVILNRMSKSYFSILKPVIEEELGVAVLGYLSDNAAFHVKSRHLGLQKPDELPEIQETLKAVAVELVKTLDMERLMAIANGAEELEVEEAKRTAAGCDGNEAVDDSSTCLPHSARPVIAVARDEAFCFYYEDNLRTLKECGAELRYFSPLHDPALPDGCSGLLLGGGYPELYAAGLSSNKTMLESVRNAMIQGLPTVAECGGFMYLHTAIEDQSGTEYTMVGFLPGRCTYTGKLVRFGYIEVEENSGVFLPAEEKIRAHEFHYFDSTDNGNGCTASKPMTRRTYPCVVTGKTYWLGFPHLYYPSNPTFAERFMRMADAYRLHKNIM